jgi:UDP-glucose 4-epimerase
MKLLITGGAGYIGSVTNKYLRENGIDTMVFDNLSTGHRQAIGDTPLVIGDLKNRQSIVDLFQREKFDGVIHFAALALAGESMEKPALYYENNILGGLNLLEAMRMSGCQNIVFSSTCAVYGFPQSLPVTEKESYKPVSVYGSSKRMFEEILDWYERIYGINYASLRYFNAAGAMLNGSIGEFHPTETHIIPIAIDVACGKRPVFTVYGNDYQTTDGTCIRDYIHVLDLASAHLKAITHLIDLHKSLTVNLGVGRGYSNLEILQAIETISKKTIKREFGVRRPGDPDSIFADSRLAAEILDWKPKYSDIDTIVESAWKWHTAHPEGYDS